VTQCGSAKRPSQRTALRTLRVERSGSRVERWYGNARRGGVRGHQPGRHIQEGCLVRTAWGVEADQDERCPVVRRRQSHRHCTIWVDGRLSCLSHLLLGQDIPKHIPLPFPSAGSYIHDPVTPSLLRAQATYPPHRSTPRDQPSIRVWLLCPPEDRPSPSDCPRRRSHDRVMRSRLHTGVCDAWTGGTLARDGSWARVDGKGGYGESWRDVRAGRAAGGKHGSQWNDVESGDGPGAGNDG
jgi:hypothetical protein